MPSGIVSVAASLHGGQRRTEAPSPSPPEGHPAATARGTPVRAAAVARLDEKISSGHRSLASCRCASERCGRPFELKPRLKSGPEKNSSSFTLRRLITDHILSGLSHSSVVRNLSMLCSRVSLGLPNGYKLWTYISTSRDIHSTATVCVVRLSSEKDPGALEAAVSRQMSCEGGGQ